MPKITVEIASIYQIIEIGIYINFRIPHNFLNFFLYMQKLTIIINYIFNLQIYN
jgi:hypothetical protein